MRSIPAIVLIGALTLSPRIGFAQGLTANVAGFELHAASIDYDDKTGDFTIPSKFTGRRDGTDIAGDRATGNQKTKMMDVVGDVVVHQTQPLEKSGDLSSVGKEPSTLTCDHLMIDGKLKLYTAIGHVHYVQGKRNATAERGSLNETTHELHMEGRVHVQDGDQTIDADTVDYNTQTGAGHAQGNVILRGPAETVTPGPAAASPAPRASPTGKPKRRST
ncbi:MAG: LptA/OstA family protein [Vulcanimicrobiaceae bacterium]